MATTLVYKQSPPRRAVLDDLHGGRLENVPGKTPGPDHPNADKMNQSDALVIALNNVAPHTKLYVTFSSGTPTKTGVWSLRDDLALADFTVTDNGSGDTSITHSGGKLSGATWPAEAYVVGDAGDATINVEGIANGWRVRTRVSGTLADVPFVLKLSGL